MAMPKAGPVRRGAKTGLRSAKAWTAFYRFTSKRPPRELLLRTLEHIDWEGRRSRGRTAVELGFGAGTDTLELLRRGWHVTAMDGQESAVRFLTQRVPPAHRSRLTTRVALLENLDVPPADLVYASFCLPFCAPPEFPALWRRIRRAVRPGGHFAGQFFGNHDEWRGRRPMTFHSLREVQRLLRGFKVELLRETVEEGRSFEGPKHWHFFDVIVEKPRTPPRKAR